MNTHKIFGMLAIGLFIGMAGTAAAIGGDVAGLVGATADAQASYGVDYSGAVNAIGGLQNEAQTQVEAQAYSAQATIAGGEATLEGKGHMIADNSMKASAEVKTSLLEDIGSGMATTMDWFGGLFVKPSVSAPTTGDSALNVAKSATYEIGPGHFGADALGHADITQSLGSAAGVDYNLPPPPTPKVGFLGELKASFEWIGSLGA